MGPSSRVRFHTNKYNSLLKDRKRLKSFLITLFENEGKRVESLDLIFCTDEELLEINRNFLKHDYFTDIITFDLTEDKGLIGEIYISIERIKENALLFETHLQTELHRVIFHGALHLCGYNDKTKAQKMLMREKEDIYIQHYLK